MQTIIYLKTHWHIIVGILILVGLVAAAYIDWQFVQLGLYGPRDTVGNGITVGPAKAFDNRSLSLRIERLSNSLAQLKVVDQKAVESIGRLQGQTSTSSSQNLTLEVKSGIKPPTNTPQAAPANTAAADDSKKATAGTTENKAEPKTEISLASGDILNEQLNLASQIMNLQTLYERSLTDRLIGQEARLQTVLGFQVSITPPAGFENCVAVVEIAVQMTPPAKQKMIIESQTAAPVLKPPPQPVTPEVKTGIELATSEVKTQSQPGNPKVALQAQPLAADKKPDLPWAALRVPPNPPVSGGGRVSLVALIPQEKTYNAQSISTNSQSIGGSAVASVVTLGVTSKGESRQLFVHRDSDTVAFERSPDNEPQLFSGKNAIVFGWEFRPVLGRQTVSPGIRQMLAVIALPSSDTSEHEQIIDLQIRTRTYWRRYDATTQTTSPKWHWFPGKIDGSGLKDSDPQELAIPTTAKFQRGLAPKVAKINWVNSGPDLATVIVKGENFFPGTKVIAAGKIHREEDATLTLKSDQALEFETTVEAIASGDAVLSGRFGRSSQLELENKIPGVKTLYITRAGIKQSRRGKDLRISIDVKGLDAGGNDIDLLTESLGNLPDPILFIGNEAIPMPYDYWPVEPHPPDPTALTAATRGETVTKGGEFSFAKPSTQKSMRVEAWIPSRISVSKNTSVTFRVPFCGLEYQASCPLQFFEPTVTRLGGGGENAVFRISHSLWHARAMTVELDRMYTIGFRLEKVSKEDGDYRFTIPTKILDNYQNLVLRIEGAEPYVIPIPPNKPKPQPVLNLNAKPPEIVKETIGPAEWSGTDLSLITAAFLIVTPTTVPDPKPIRTTAHPTSYDDGKKIIVYFSKESTKEIGMVEVEFQMDPNATVVKRVPLVIVEKASAII
jgi:hypothetical protein